MIRKIMGALFGSDEDDRAGVLPPAETPSYDEGTAAAVEARAILAQLRILAAGLAPGSEFSLALLTGQHIAPGSRTQKALEDQAHHYGLTSVTVVDGYEIRAIKL